MRIEQKERTRQALLQAAAAIAAEGSTPTINDAAARAGVSRATAYRHFPSQDLLIIEVSLPLAQLRAALGKVGRSDPVKRIGAMVRTIAEWAFEHQLVLREMLRVSLTDDARSRGYTRPVNRIELIAKELEPFRADVSPKDFRRLRAAMTLVLGIDAIVVLQDIAGLPQEEVIDVLAWTAMKLASATVGK